MDGVDGIGRLKVGGLVFVLGMLLCGLGVAGEDPVIAYHQGLLAASEGDSAPAFGKFRTACLASDGVFEACVLLGEAAETTGDDKVLSQALASAVMLRPEDVGARYRMALYLLEKGDFAFAEMHLAAALPLAELQENRGLFAYYLGYARFKQARFDDARAAFDQATPLPPALVQRRAFYLGAMAAEQADRRTAVGRLKRAEAGPDRRYADAAQSLRRAQSLFGHRPVLGGLAGASIGINTHPSSAFLDAPGTDPGWTLSSIFRADGILRRPIGDHLVEGGVTLYRDQGYVTVGQDEEQAPDDNATEASRISDKDFNLTLLLGQAGYRRRFWGRTTEHELRVLLEGEVQLLDGVPEKISSPGTNSVDFTSGDFGVNTFAVGGRIWWSFSTSPSAQTSLRFRAEGRPNRSDPDRSAIRFRWRLSHTRYFFKRSLKGVGLVGLRFDRTYDDPNIIKYDRLLPELDLNVDWTPMRRLSILLGATLKLNAYPNSAHDSQNSFKEPWQDDSRLGIIENQNARDAYYKGLKRLDLEWEARAESAVTLWKNAALALTYRHHQRISNIDDAAIPDHFVIPEGTENEYGYRQHLLELVLRQGF